MSTSYGEAAAAFGSSFFDFPIGEDLSYLFNNIQEEQSLSPSPLLPSPPPQVGVAMADKGKRPAEYQLPEAPVVKRHRSPTSSRENSGGSNDGVEQEHEQGSEVAAPGGGRRRLWVKERDREWWDAISSPACPEEEFRRAFRMSRATFEYICAELGGAVAKEDTMLRAAIPVRQRVAVCIWRLATGEPLRLVSKRFGLGISTCHKLVLEGCAAIKGVLMPSKVRWPDNPDAVAAQFKARHGIPDVVGAIYTTHIPIIAPKANVAAYYNRRHTERNQKTSYSITVQGVVDAAGNFTDVCIGWPGSMDDADVLERSALYAQRGNAGLLDGRCLVGGAEYPLMDWMLTPYTHRNKTWVQHVLNERVDAVRGVAKDAFRRLKARWGCLQKRTEVKLQDLPIVLGACCVLHNICEQAGDALHPDVAGYQIFDDEMVAKNPVRSQAAVVKRDKIAHNLLHSTDDGGSVYP